MMKDRSPMPRDDKKEAGRSKKVYKHDLRDLQIELVKIQRRAIAHNHRILIIFEGRDAAGKDGIIKRITEHLSPRETRVVALGKPSDRDTRSWYFQRYASHLPADGEIVLFNRSWYNRAVANNAVFERAIENIRDEVEAGKSLAGPLRKAGIFPPMAAHMAQSGEKSGRLEEMMLRIADTYEREVANSVNAMTALLEPIMILLMGVAVGFIVLAVLLPILDMSQAIH